MAIGATLDGGAQTPSSRFAFADTTLLRDTLGLRFDGLFELADSLGMMPDSLRAQSIRHRLSLARLLQIADSLRVPVDSVGVTLLRERFNPLAQAGERRVTTLHYASGVDLARTVSSWTNTIDYQFVNGPWFVRNNTNMQMDRYKVLDAVELRQNRYTLTEAGWRFSPQLSIGARANLDWFDSFRKGGSAVVEPIRKNEFQLSARSRHEPGNRLSTELNLFSGIVDVTREKRGASADLNGRVRYSPTKTFAHDLSGSVRGNLAHSRRPDTDPVRTQDLSLNLRGSQTVTLLKSIDLNANYAFRNDRVETPADSGRLRRVTTDARNVDVSVRFRASQDRSLTITQRYGSTDRQELDPVRGSSGLAGITRGFNAAGRYNLYGWSLDASFDQSLTADVTSRNALLTVYRELGSRITARGTGQVQLSRFGSRDIYRQSYRMEALYTRSEALNGALALEVLRGLSINIPSRLTRSNSETRTYRAEWRWSYRLLPRMTAAQQNQLNAEYLTYYNRPLDNRLGLDYRATTTISALISPRATLALTHKAFLRPSGNYTRLSDGLEYFGKSDETREYTLTAGLGYTPVSAFSLNVSADYRSRSSLTSSSPTREDKNLVFTGGANVNVPFGSRGRITGNIGRTYAAGRTFDPARDPTPRQEQDYWNGRMELSWDL